MVIFSPVRRLRNTKRRLLKKRFDFVYLSLPSSFPLRTPPQQPFIQRLLYSQSDFSLELVNQQVSLIKRSKFIQGLIIELPLSIQLPMGYLQQLQAILQDLKQADKKIIIIAKQYDMRLYFLASIADKILLLPTGILDTKGLLVEIYFLKEALKKTGIQFEKIAVSGYKSAFDQFTRDSIAPESKENLEWLIKDLISIFKATLSKNRKMSNQAIDELINQSPWIDQDALKNNFIDDIVRPEDLPEYLGSVEKPAKIVFFSRISKLLPIQSKPSDKNLIALIPIVGTIIDGNSRDRLPIPLPIPLPFPDDAQVGDKSVVQIIRRVRRNPKFKGAILAVDSPGGSSLASEEIRSALVKLRNKKPLVSYFNSVSASGGYYISTPAHWIVAQPSTITGSIGVLFVKPNIEDLLKKSGINLVTIQEGDHANWSSINAPFSSEEKISNQKLVDRIYDHFLSLVAESRNKTIDEVRKIAGGRVYTGNQALNNGLIDQIGSLFDAKQKICTLANIEMKSPLVTAYPPKKMQFPPFYSKQKNLNILESYSDYLKPWMQNKLWMYDFRLKMK